jgi:hypothetical protein
MKMGLRLSERSFMAGEQAAQYQNTENHQAAARFARLKPATTKELTR